MTKKIEDKVFGELEYKHSWIKKDTLEWNNRKFSVNIIAQAYSNDEILDSQREMYLYYTKNISKIIQEAIPKIIQYCQSFLGQIDKIDESLLAMLVPRTVLFERDNTWGVLFDTNLDVENGIALFIVNNKIKVSQQDIFL